MNGFYDSLRIAIIKQAVDDYMTYARSIRNLTDNKQKVIIDIIVRDSKFKRPNNYTYYEADNERLKRIQILKDKMDDIERFFRSPYYAVMCNIEAEYMIKRIRERAKKLYSVKI